MPELVAAAAEVAAIAEVSFSGTSPEEIVVVMVEAAINHLIKESSKMNGRILRTISLWLSIISAFGSILVGLYIAQNMLPFLALAPTIVVTVFLLATFDEWRMHETITGFWLMILLWLVITAACLMLWDIAPLFISLVPCALIGLVWLDYKLRRQR